MVNSSRHDLEASLDGLAAREGHLEAGTQIATEWRGDDGQNAPVLSGKTLTEGLEVYVLCGQQSG